MSPLRTQSLLVATLLGVGLCAGPRPALAERRCGTRSHQPLLGVLEQSSGHRTNCSAVWTNPDPSYADGGLLEFKIVVHVIESADGTDGGVTDEQIVEQIRVLNEDFRASGAADGSLDTELGFALATVDPEGRPTRGITRHQNDVWFADRRDYWAELAWDPERYINVYTNDAQGLLGYTYLPADSSSAPGDASDRIVIEWQHIGRDMGAAGNRGRTLTHEMGHYLGLDHTFAPNPTTPETFVCAPAEPPECYGSGDLVCDTPSEDSANEDCAPRQTCDSDDAVDNFMNYTPDACMNRFTSEQALRMRCSVLGYRPDIAWPAGRIAVTELPRLAGFARLGVELANDSAFTQSFTLQVASEDGEARFADGAGSSDGAASLETVALSPSELIAAEVRVPVADADVELVLQADSNLNERTAVLPVLIEHDPPPALTLTSDVVELAASADTPARFELTLANAGVLPETVVLNHESGFATDLLAESELSLAALESRAFYLEVAVPPTAAPGSRRSVVVTAQNARRPEAVQSLRLWVNVERFVDAHLRAEQEAVDVRPGQAGSLTFVLENRGNAEESYRLDVATPGPVSAWPRDWSVGPLAPLHRDGPSRLTVDYEVLPDARPGDDLLLTLTATANDTTLPAASAEVRLHVAETGHLALTPRLQTRTTDGTEPERFELVVGNRSGGTERITLELASESEVVTAPPSSISLAGGEERQVSFALRPRVKGAIERTAVTARSLDHPERSQTSEVLLALAPTTDSDAGDTVTGPSAPAGCSCRLGDPRGGPSPHRLAFLGAGAGLLLAARRRRRDQDESATSRRLATTSMGKSTCLVVRSSASNCKH